MNEEMREKIIGEFCTMVEHNPGLLRMIELLDKLYRDVEKIKQEITQIQQDARPNHMHRIQALTETMLFSLAEIEAKGLLEEKNHEQNEIIKQQEQKIKAMEEAYRQVAAARKDEVDSVHGEIEVKNELLKEIKKGLSGFCSLSKAKRWQLLLNEDSIIGHLKGVEQKIDFLMSAK